MIHIGTSGWNYQHWRDVFYPRGLPSRVWLEHYASEFETVEVNATFYRLLPASTFEGWRARTPEGFLFAIKAPRTITHRKRLADCEEELAAFLARARLLGDRLGPLLFQLPPNWGCDPERLSAFLRHLSGGPRCAFEFRSESWHCEAVYCLLREADAALVRVSAPRFPDADVRTADFQYVRMHGKPRLYVSKYSDAELARWAGEITAWAGAGQEVFVYFNNDAHGHAVEDARQLRRLLESRC